MLLEVLTVDGRMICCRRLNVARSTLRSFCLIEGSGREAPHLKAKDLEPSSSAGHSRHFVANARVLPSPN